MQISANQYSVPNESVISFREQTASSPNVVQPVTETARPQLDLRQLHQRLEQVLGSVASFSNGAQVNGARANGAQANQSARHAETSFSPHRPSFAGNSSAQVTVEGEYDGSSGTTMLSFAVVSSDNSSLHRSLEIKDGQGRIISSVQLPPLPDESSYPLPNGLTVNLAAESLELGDSFEIEVHASAGPSTLPMNASVGRSLQPSDATGTVDVTANQLAEQLVQLGEDLTRVFGDSNNGASLNAAQLENRQEDSELLQRIEEVVRKTQEHVGAHHHHPGAILDQII